jgi:phosphoribosylamine--glycine ligase
MVGPEAALVLGLVDRLTEIGIKAFGPTAAAAELEGSKAFMKELCHRHNIPTAEFARFTDAAAARAYIAERGAPIVVKADGLAAGKGVTVAHSVAEAYAAVDEALVDGAFGSAGAELVIEEFMTGEEVSFFVMSDGKTALPLTSAQDHKTVGEGDTGPNTGGMGAYSPAPVLTPALQDRGMREIIEPTVAAMAAEGRAFKGILYAGLMLTPEGPKLLEYNARFGDPETQVLMVRLMSDLLPALIAVCDGCLRNITLRWYDDTALCVVMAAEGYPGDYLRHTEILGLDKAGALEDVSIFHAGTTRDNIGRLLACGGRVLGITAIAPDVRAAAALAYRAVDMIDWPEGFCRRDIGWRAMN